MRPPHPEIPDSSSISERAERIAEVLPSIMNSIMMSRTHQSKRPGPEMTFHQYRSLLIIKEIGPCSLQSLAAGIRLATSTTSQLVDRLVKAGLVTREPHESDRRMIVLKISKQGELIVLRRAEELKRNYMRMLAMLSDEEQEEFEHAFRSISRAARKIEAGMLEAREKAMAGNPLGHLGNHLGGLPPGHGHPGHGHPGTDDTTHHG